VSVVGGKESRKSSAGAGVAKSSAVAKAPSHHHPDTLAVLIGVAEDCFARAQSAVRDVARSREANDVNEYCKLIATGLGCLEAALQTKNLAPRLEAKMRLRYAGLLVDETENLMKAETALTKGIALCEKVKLIVRFRGDSRLTLYVASLFRPPVLYAISSPESIIPKKSQGGIDFRRWSHIRLYYVRCFPPLILNAPSHRLKQLQTHPLGVRVSISQGIILPAICKCSRCACHRQSPQDFNLG
jgi:hypothetical protein